MKGKTFGMFRKVSGTIILGENGKSFNSYWNNTYLKLMTQKAGVGRMLQVPVITQWLFTEQGLPTNVTVASLLANMPK